MSEQNFIARPALAVYNTGTSGPIPITGTLQHILDNPNAYGTSSGDYFGYSVAISTNYTIVGAYQEDESAADLSSGKAYIFDNATGVLLHTIDNPNSAGTSNSDQFGWSVAITSNYAIVGARQEEDGGQGAAYIFDVTTGNLLHTITNPNPYAESWNDDFGYSVSISGNRAVVGAYGEDSSSGSDNSGAAYIFDVTTGNLLYTLFNPNAYGTPAGDRFGSCVSIDGDRVIVGAYLEDSAGGSSSGAAYIFDANTGNLLHTLTNPSAVGSTGADQFGYSVSISGDRAIVGAFNEYNPDGSSTSGVAYIFDVTTGNLLHTLTNPNAYGTPAGDRFGWSVSISGDRAIVGAYLEDDAGGTDSGAAYIFDASTGNLLHTLTNPNAYNTSAGDLFGYSVAISGNQVVVGAYAEDDAGGTSSGKAYIYN